MTKTITIKRTRLTVSPSNRKKILYELYQKCQSTKQGIPREARELARFIIEFYCKFPKLEFMKLKNNSIVGLSVFSAMIKLYGNRKESVTLVQHLHQLLSNYHIGAYLDLFTTKYVEAAFSKWRVAVIQRRLLQEQGINTSIVRGSIYLK